MKGNLRVVLYTLAAGLFFILWQRWQVANRPVEVSPTLPVASQTVKKTETPDQQPPISASETSEAPDRVRVKTDVLDIAFSTQGASIVEAKLLNYAFTIDNKSPLTLLHAENPSRMVFQSGLVSQSGTTAPNHFSQWKSAQKEYVLPDDAEHISVPFTWEDEHGVRFTKTFTFHRGTYRFEIEETVENQSERPWQGFAYRQIAFGEAAKMGGLGQVATFTGAVTSSEENRYNKIELKDIASAKKAKLNEVTQTGWVAMMQHYFLAAVVPQSGVENRLYTQYDNGDHIVGTHDKEVTIAPRDTHHFKSTGYIGPKISKNLSAIAPYLDKTIDYGYLFMISQLMFHVMTFIYTVIGNWGGAIIVMTLLIKCLFFVPSAWAYKSMAKMRALQPEINRLKAQYGEDKQAFGQAMMQLYRDRKVNPASGCLPMLLQIPFFIAFYWVLAESVELRHAPWIGWIQDLSSMDPLYILPIINAALMFLQQKLNPPPPDPTQAKVMMMMPLVFGFMFMWFPSGLVLYWTMSNAFSIVQQYVMNKRYGQRVTSAQS